MTERIYTHAEVSELLAKTARLEAAAGPRSSGLTLSEVKEAARAAGMDPKWVDTALKTSGSKREPKTYGGIVSSAHRDLILPNPISEEQWGRIVAELRRTLGGKGTAETIGETRAWDNKPYRVMIDNVDGRAIVTADADWTAETTGNVLATGLSVLGAIGIGIPALITNAQPMVVLSLMLALIATVSAAITWGAYRKKAGRLGDKMDDALNQIERLSKVSGLSAGAVVKEGADVMPGANGAEKDQRRDLLDSGLGYWQGDSAATDRSTERA